MRMQPLGLLLLLFLSPNPAAASASLSGEVMLVAGQTPRPDASNAVVWLEGAHHPDAAANPTRGQMKSDQKKFRPRVVAVPKSATVDFPNVDPIYHNVFSVSGANRFDLGLYRSGASKAQQFVEPGLVRVYCNIHPQMVGFVMVVDSDFVAVTGPDGKFHFDGVPAGAYTLKVWHEESGETSTPVTLREGADTAPPIRLDVSGYQQQPHKNKYGKEYPPQPASEDERY